MGGPSCPCHKTLYSKGLRQKPYIIFYSKFYARSLSGFCPSCEGWLCTTPHSTGIVLVNRYLLWGIGVYHPSFGGPLDTTPLVVDHYVPPPLWGTFYFWDPSLPYMPPERLVVHTQFQQIFINVLPNPSPYPLTFPLFTLFICCFFYINLIYYIKNNQLWYKIWKTWNIWGIICWIEKYSQYPLESNNKRHKWLIVPTVTTNK